MDKNIFKELQDTGMSTGAINQHIKCKENGVIVSSDVENVELLRNFLFICKKHNFDFDYSQQQVIYKGLSVGLSVAQVDTYANPDFNIYTMEQLFAALVKGVDISKWVPLVTNLEALSHIRLLKLKGFSDEKIQLYLDCIKSYSYDDLYEVRFCIECGMPDSEIKKMREWDTSKKKKARLKYLKEQKK